MTRKLLLRSIVLVVFVFSASSALPCQYCLGWEDFETGQTYKECANESDVDAPQYAGCEVVSFCGGKKGKSGTYCVEECDGDLCVIA